MIYRALAITAAFCGSLALVHAEGWQESAGSYFSRERASVSHYGQVPKYLTPNNRAGNARIVAAAARRHGVPERLALALTRQESGFNERARSPVGAMGLTQVMPGTWRSEGCRGNPWDATANADCGMRYLAKFYREGGAHYAALRYHGGPNTRMHGPKTRKYAARVVAMAGMQTRPAQPPLWAGKLQVAWRQ